MRDLPISGVLAGFAEERDLSSTPVPEPRARDVRKQLSGFVEELRGCEEVNDAP